MIESVFLHKSFCSPFFPILIGGCNGVIFQCNGRLVLLSVLLNIEQCSIFSVFLSIELFFPFLYFRVDRIHALL